MLCAFELGRKKELCLAELLSLFGEVSFKERNFDTAVFEIPPATDMTALQNRLGGTVKIVEILREVDSPALSDLKRPLEEILSSELSGHTGKLIFSISALSFLNVRDVNIKELLNFSKKFLKSLEISCRFVNKDFKTPKPSTIYKARVLEKGIDICIINGREKILLGKTVSIQNIDDYSFRDYEKPGRDAHVGMLPPKLAQILINLCNPHAKTVYDPFCGAGTILMEALLMGKSAVGSDLEPRMTEYSEKNCNWLMENFSRISANKNSIPTFRVFQKDAQALTKTDLPERIDAVVSEGYLGPAISRFPDPNKKKLIFNEILGINQNFLHAISPLIPGNCKIVLCLPAFKDRERIDFLPDFDRLIKPIGYKVTKSLLYDRPDQVVAREIKVIEKI